MSLEQYWVQLNEIENRFNCYKQDLENIIIKISSAIDHTIITKGEIVNSTPYYYERMGSKVNGKVLSAPIISDHCKKYHYDRENRLILIEEYSVFFERISS